jgi:hypothetical protein
VPPAEYRLKSSIKPSPKLDRPAFEPYIAL